MESQINSPNPIEPDAQRSHHLRQMLGAAGATLALLGAGPAAATAEASHTHPEVPTEVKLTNPSSLPGYDRLLKPEARDNLANSTVNIVKRFKDTEEWQQVCTGVKVSTGTGIYISTAAHCFRDFTGAGIEPALDGPADQPKAFNIAERAKGYYEFAVTDPKLAKELRQPLATIDGISVSNRGHDRALLSLQPRETTVNTSQFRTFDQIKSMPLALEQKHAVKRPLPGQRVALFGVPEANGERQLAGLGRYLGRIRLPLKNGGTQYIDVVGTKPARIDQDTCNFGASGSSFSATSGKSAANTYVSGPLSHRLNSIWDPYLIDNTMDFSDQRGNVTNEIADSKYWRDYYQRKVGVKLRSFSTICGFQVSFPDASRELVEGLKVSLPEVQFPDKGGDGAVGFDSGKGGDDSQSMK